ncbi:helix-turn-helix domain-containing protein [Pseudophaeobacter sp.]|jgi:protein-tyrosine-phosphatase/DNA-binding transcriptional ArsR family regulator|uniref:arsenate reductase/protein-tyrosine-phosphatase family protein n=1 Tax=Pseudophaeobacter sp. TaxID=1971739 RepID=UPI003A987DEC
MEESIPLRLSILGHPQRLAVFRLLMRRYPDRVAAGEIAAALGIKPSTLSSYLSALTLADLVTKTREGTWQRYQINMTATRQTLDALYLDCCRGRPDLCGPTADPDMKTDMETDMETDLNSAPTSFVAVDTSQPRPYNVLFLCTGNSARSIFAEAILTNLAPGRFRTFSAGTTPHTAVNPVAAEMLKSKGLWREDLHPKLIQEIIDSGAPKFDFVFTVCDQAANEECPAWEGQPISAHWGMPDPVKATGTEAQKSLAFQQAYGVLHRRLRAFAALPLQQLDLISLQHAVDGIAQDHDEDKP